MAIQITPPIEAIGFSKDPILWTFEDDLTGYTLGTSAQNVLKLTGAVASGTRLAIRWNDVDLRLVAKPTPDQSGDEFPSGDGSQAYAETLADWLALNYFINQDFSVTASVFEDMPAVFLSARQSGSLYNATLSSFAGGQVINNIPGTDTNRPANSSVFLEVYLQKPSGVGFDRVYQAPLEFDQYRQVHFDVAPLLHAYLEPELQSFVLPVAAPCLYSKRKYYLVYAPAGGENFSPGQLLTTELYHVTLGSIHRYTTPATLTATFKGTTAEEDKFLRVKSGVRFIRPDEPVFLTWINFRGDGLSIRYQATVTYDNNDTEVFYSDPVSPINTYDKLVFGLGIRQTEFLTFRPDDRVVEYSVQLIDAVNNVISETVRFVVDYAYRQNVRYFAYTNSYGALEMAKTYGRSSSEFKLFRERADQVLPFQFESQDAQLQEWNLSYEEIYQVATGYLPRRDLSHFLDFFLSPQKYRVTAGTPYPIVINTETIKRGKDYDNLYALTFEYQYARRNDAVSELEAEGLDGGGEAAYPLGVVVAGDISLPPPTPTATGFTDPYPVAGSANAVASGGVKAALDEKQDKLPAGTNEQFFRGDGSLFDFPTAVKAAQEHRTASLILAGEILLASTQEVKQGTNTTKAVTPSTLRESFEELAESQNIIHRHPWFVGLPTPAFTAGEMGVYEVDLADFLVEGILAENLEILKGMEIPSWCKIEVIGTTITITATPPTTSAVLPLIPVQNNAKPLEPTQTWVKLPDPAIALPPPDYYVTITNPNGSTLYSIKSDGTADQTELEKEILPFIEGWDVRWYIRMGVPFDFFEINTYKLVSEEWVLIAWNYAAIQEDNVLNRDSFGSNYNLTHPTVPPHKLDSGQFKQITRLWTGGFDSGTEVFNKEVFFTITAPPPACDKPPTFSAFLRPDPIYNVISGPSGSGAVGLTFDFDAINVFEMLVHCWRKSDNLLMWTITAAPGEGVDTVADASQQIAFPFIPDDTYVFGLEGKSCKSGVSKLEFTIGQVGNPALPQVISKYYKRGPGGETDAVFVADLVDNTETIIPFEAGDETKGWDIQVEVRNRLHNGWRLIYQRWENGAWVYDGLTKYSSGSITTAEYNRTFWISDTFGDNPYGFKHRTEGKFRYVLSITYNDASVDGKAYPVNYTQQVANGTYSGMDVSTQGGKTFNIIPSNRTTYQVLASGNIRIILPSATVSSENGQKTCLPYLLHNERPVRQALRDALFSGSGAALPAGRTYTFQVVWLPQDVFPDYATLSSANDDTYFSVLHANNNNFLNHGGGDYLRISID